MTFFEIFFPALTAIWLVVGTMCIGPGISDAESRPWGSEKTGGDLTKLGIATVSAFYLFTGPIYILSLVRQK